MTNPSYQETEAVQSIAQNLAQKLEDLARAAFKNAEKETTQEGKRFIEHGAICYFNSAAEVRKAFGLPELTGEQK